jgi:hypothetical protein
MPTPETLRDALTPLCHTLSTVDPTDAAAATAHLNATQPLSALTELRALLFAARDEGWLTPRRATPTLTYGRIAKSSTETLGFAIDVVDMVGPGAEHIHPNGEINLCFRESGDPRFCGAAEGWYVVPPGSRHIPEVTGGRMVICYFLPGGEIQFV